MLAWAYLSSTPWQVASLLPLTLIGPIVYSLMRRYSEHTFFGRRKPYFVFSDYIAIVLVALVPSSLIGTFLYHQQLANYKFIDTLLVYALADFLGVLIFLPLSEAMLKLGQRKHWPSLSPLCFTLAMAAVPAAFKVYGFSGYASAAEVLLFPLFAVMISRYNRQSLAFASFLLAIVITLSAGYGVQQLADERQIEAFLFVTFWLIAVLMATQVLHQSRAKQQYLIGKNAFLASHNQQTLCPNRMQLRQDYQAQAPEYLNIVQTKDRDSINQTLSTIEIAELEQVMAQTLRDALPEHTIYHIAEMRFVVLSERNLAQRAENLQQLEVALGKSGNYIDLGWGLIRCNTDGFDKNMSYANAALNIALTLPNHRIYGPLHDELIDQQLAQLEKYLAYMHALEHDGLQIYYQPILNLELGKITSAELLSRLSMQGKVISPIEFIDTLKSFDALSKFDRLVIKQAAKQLHTKPLQRLSRININITGASLSDKGFISWLNDNLKASDYPQQTLCFEITESDHIRDWQQAERNAMALTNLGFQLAIDDFGTGLASYEYLNRFPMAKLLKIDGLFIKDLARSPKQQAFVKASMMIANSQNLEVCAEYVDNQDTVDYLKTIGVKYAQGYFVSRPLLLANR
ncbi:MAG: EAL domain-containing protein, partial [Pseudomonadales bacterium]|nr:EAL domain-containing protein [Pseudomonadales bacterium]